MNAMKSGHRVLYYDAIKVLALYLVCIYHYNHLHSNILDQQDLATYANYFLKGFSSMAVPLFFMVNGALLLNRSYELGDHLRRTFCLYVLVLAWSFVSLVGFMPIYGYSYSVQGFIRDLLYLRPSVSDHLWFLQTLISVYLLFPLVKEVYDSSNRKLLYLLCLIFFFFSFGNLLLNVLVNVTGFVSGFSTLRNDGFDFFPLINPFGNYFYAFLYFIVGGLLAERISKSRIRISNWLLFTSFLVSSLLLFLYGVLMTSSNHELYDTVWNGYTSLMTLIMSVSAFLFLSKIDYKNERINQTLTVIGANTLGIYLVHRFVGATITPYFRHFSLSSVLAINIFYGFLILLSSLLVVLILKRVPLLNMAVDLGALTRAVEGAEARIRKIFNRLRSAGLKTNETADVVKDDE